MHINWALATTLFSSTFLFGLTYADQELPPEPEAPSSPSSSSSSAAKPIFTPTDLKAPFLEQFTSDWETRWTPSHAKKEDSKTDEEWTYVGEWAVEEPMVLSGMVGDKGLVVKNAAAHHAISAKFPEKIDNTGKSLVLQYEVKPQNGLECGGAYMKLLRDTEALQSEEFSNASPYVIMFGPDKCGATNKVHFIFQHKNPKTGEYQEKHLKSAPSAKTVKMSTLYTLVVRPDNTFEMLIDNVSAKNGSLLEDFSPSVNPEKEIDDPNDTKPDDWVDLARIPDPDATKPEDWNEDEPFEIEDPEATKPEDWLDDEPSVVPDPEAEKPDDWVDDEDGDWVPPSVPNPKCEIASGCGPWKPPMIKNPNYKGKWSAPYIENPAYKGPWAPRKIANPEYFEEKHPANFEPMGAIGFEIWTMQKDILFDNIYIGHSVEDAAALREETWDIKRPVETAEDAALRPKLDEKNKSPMNLSFKDEPLKYVKEKLELFVTIAKRDPMEAVRFLPEVVGAIGISVVALLAILVAALGIGKSSATPSKENLKNTAEKAKTKVVDGKNQAAESLSSGVENAQSEVTRRTTRSTAAAE